MQVDGLKRLAWGIIDMKDEIVSGTGLLRLSNGKLDSHTVSIENKVLNMHVCHIYTATTCVPRHEVK